MGSHVPIWLVLLPPCCCCCCLSAGLRSSQNVLRLAWTKDAPFLTICHAMLLLLLVLLLVLLLLLLLLLNCTGLLTSIHGLHD
jgi:uncharacterized BrkB/YihY/UPF0761 family membrane protein